MQYQPTITAAKEQHTAPKLKVGASHDAHEQEADAVADRVMRMPLSGASPLSVRQGEAGTLQRKCDACEKEEEKVQRKPLIQAKSQMAQGGFEVPSQVGNQIAATRGGGNALDQQARGWGVLKP
jgi:hypothetical protein